MNDRKSLLSRWLNKRNADKILTDEEREEIDKVRKEAYIKERKKMAKKEGKNMAKEIKR